MKIAVTTLDDYRYWRETEFEDAEMEARIHRELVAKIKGERMPMSDAALRGIAFARVTEAPEEYAAGDVYRCDGYEFDASDVNKFLLNFPSYSLAEVWMPHYSYGGHYLVGRADRMWGATIADTKLITKAFNAKKYESYDQSVQWKAELLMADCHEFQYFVAHGKHRRSDDVITLADTHKLTYYRSPATDDEVRRLMVDFGYFAEPHLEGK